MAFQLHWLRNSSHSALDELEDEELELPELLELELLQSTTGVAVSAADERSESATYRWLLMTSIVVQGFSGAIVRGAKCDVRPGGRKVPNIRFS